MNKNIIFKEGDLVYDLCPLDIKVYKVSPLNIINSDRIVIHDTIFYNNGKYYFNEPFPSLVPANEETYKAIKTLYPNRKVQSPEDYKDEYV